MSNVEIHDEKVKRAFKSLEKAMKAAKPINNQIGIILEQGFVEQFEEAGRHWGDKWERSGELIAAIREWQGYNYDQSVPGTGTGTTKSSFTHVADNKGVVVGTPLQSAKSFQEGGGGHASFRKKGGSSETWDVTFNNVPSRQVTPDKLTKQEEQAIFTAIKKGFLDVMG